MARVRASLFVGVLGSLVLFGSMIGRAAFDPLPDPEPAPGPFPVPRTDFVNWESPHVHPLDMTPDGRFLLAVNTADNRLEIFDLDQGRPTGFSNVHVGLDPISVRARNNREAWVVNHISDTVSIVDLYRREVKATIHTSDEPADVVFAGSSGRAFVTCSETNTIQVYEPDLSLAAEITIGGENPRALAVSPDGRTVFAAIFNSGNKSTVLNGGNPLMPEVPMVVGLYGTPYTDLNQPFQQFINPPWPPPNNGTTFSPPINPNNALPTIPTSLIVKRSAAGPWMDDNNHDWSLLVDGQFAPVSGRPVGWSLPDRDVAILDADSLTVRYATSLMNNCLALGVNPASGAVSVVGTDATNEVRFEPNVNGTFVRVNIGTFRPGAPDTSRVVRDLNPHLSYATHSVPQGTRNDSVGDPRGIAWEADGSTGYVSGMGSNNVIVINRAGARASGIPPAGGGPIPVVQPPINVGEGPTGLVMDSARRQLYVLNRFAGSVSVIDTTTRRETARVPFYDPTPTEIKVGRKHLFDTHKNSGLGQASCASCHVDTRMDRLAWDLGDPSGLVIPNGFAHQNLAAAMPQLGGGLGFGNWHVMKGPMTTQTLQDIIGHEPHHWRGDRDGIEAFNPAFMSLLGDDTMLTAVEMQQFEDYLSTITFPPNPFRNLDNTLPAFLPLPGEHSNGRFANLGGLQAGQPLPPGDAQRGLDLYVNQQDICAGTLSCVQCHSLPTGMGTDYTWNGSMFTPFPAGPNGERHRMIIANDAQTNRTIKVPQLRNMYKKTGCDFTQMENLSGFGFMHDGTTDSLSRFLSIGGFNVHSDQDVADLVAFMIAFAGSDLPQGSTLTLPNPPGGASKDTHAAVGWQKTIGQEPVTVNDILEIIEVLALADANKVGVIAKARKANLNRGYAYRSGGLFQADHAGEFRDLQWLLERVAPGKELTFTVVPKGLERRLGIDRDLDGILDLDEGGQCTADYDDGNGQGLIDNGVTIDDLLYYLQLFEEGSILADVTGGLPDDPDADDNGVTIDDLLQYLLHFEAGC